jgi:hypothetical protein
MIMQTQWVCAKEGLVVVEQSSGCLMKLQVIDALAGACLEG